MTMTMMEFCFRIAPFLFFLVVTPHHRIPCTSIAVDAAAPAPTPAAAATAAASRRTPSAAFYPHGRDRPHGYTILREEVRYAGWRTVLRRRVARPPPPPRSDRDGAPPAALDFDVVDQARAAGGAVVVFAWNATAKTATIVREYMPGPHRVLSGLAAGLVEEKHAAPGGGAPDPGVAARHELEEECHLVGGTWYRLTEDGVSVPMDKYAVTEVTPYLVVDPHHATDPRPLDEEEDIEIVAGVSADEIRRGIREGDFNLVGGWAALLALDKLRELGEIA